MQAAKLRSLNHTHDENLKCKAIMLLIYGENWTHLPETEEHWQDI